jgi:hypothetical protein
MLLILAVALLGYLAGRRFPRLPRRIGRWAGAARAAVARPPGPWRWWSRLLCVLAALAATAPVWPVIQPGDPVADEMLRPAEVAVIIPVVLVFPVAWSLLGRCRPYAWRVGVGLAGCVAGWSLWTVTFGSYRTLPTVDDGLRWYLVGTGVIVASATAIEAQRQWSGYRAAGALVWLIGLIAIFAVPVVGEEPVPPRDAILPLPAAMSVLHEEAGCARPQRFLPRDCWRTLTVAATDGARVGDLTRRLGQHLERTKGWQVTWYDFAPDPDVKCRPAGWLANPYQLCADVRSDAAHSTVEVRLDYSNRHDPIYD